MILEHGALIAVEADEDHFERLVLCLGLCVERRQLGRIFSARPARQKGAPEREKKGTAKNRVKEREVGCRSRKLESRGI